MGKKHRGKNSGHTMKENYTPNYFEGKLGVYEGGYDTRRGVVSRFYTGLLKKFKLDNGFGKKALDVGAAYGYGVEALMKLKYDAYGCDISEWAVGKANSIHGWSRCFILDVEAENLPRNAFDLIMIINTLEHFEKPENVIDNVRRALKMNGVVIVATNNLINPFSLIDKDPTHFSVYPLQRWYLIFKRFFDKVYVNTYTTFDRLVESGAFFPSFFFGFVTVIKASVNTE